MKENMKHYLELTGQEHEDYDACIGPYIFGMSP